MLIAMGKSSRTGHVTMLCSTVVHIVQHYFFPLPLPLLSASLSASFLAFMSL